MGILRYISMTGAGEATSFARMQRISKAHPFVEWGVLYSRNLAGKENRYPTLEWLEKFASKANARNMTIALHLCGGIVKDLLNQALTRQFSKDSARILALASKFGRVQLNTPAKMDQVPNFEALIQYLNRTENRTTTILQWNKHNEEVCKRLGRTHGFECLIDASGGRGLTCETWPNVSRFDIARVGYAGGLSPENVWDQLGRIATTVDERSFWVDAEGKLRDAKDQFDLDLCEAFVSNMEDYWAKAQILASAIHGNGSRKVSTLNGFWLDWWVARTQHRWMAMVIPPKDACGVMTLYRPTGKFESYRPCDNAHEALALFYTEKIALIPGDDGKWSAYPLGHEELRMTGKDIQTAGLKAVVAKHYGLSVPKSPMDLR